MDVKEKFGAVVEDIERHDRHEVDGDDGEFDHDDDDDGIWEGIIPMSEKNKESATDENTAETEVEASINTATTAQETSTTTELRQRHGHEKTSTTPSTATLASGTSTSATAQPQPQPQPTTTTTHNPPSTTETNANANTKEAALSTHRAEQETLTTSLLTLAGQLKASSEAFQTSLEHEKGILNRAVEGLDRNITGMDAAGKRMGVLRRMTEGRGWWGRMMMYAWIFGLWIVAIALVYLGPKLRF